MLSGDDPIDDVLRDGVCSGAVAGVVAFAADASGTRYCHAFGERRLGDGIPMPLDSVFWLASLTKAVTSVAAMQLVERGALHLDDSVGSIVPELAAPRVLMGFDDGGQPLTRPAIRPITLRMLLTHTAGFGYDMWSADLLRYGEFVRGPGAPASRLASLEYPLLCDPGERFVYGVNTDWVGRIVEAVTGRDLQSYVRETICAPLGMPHTSFTLDAHMRERLAGMHARGPDGALHAVRFDVADQPAFVSGGGGLYGTGSDYVRFLRMFLREGELDGVRVLQPQTVRLMLDDHIGSIAIEPMRTAMPHATNDVTFFAGDETWGLGFLRHTSGRDGGRRAGSVSWAGLANTYYWIDPVAGICAVLLAAQRPFADPAVLRLLDRFERAVYATIETSRAP